MSVEDQAKALFEQVVERPPDEHRAWLQAHCPDPAVRRRVEQLLASHAAGISLEGPARGAAVLLETEASSLPDRLGAFEIRSVLGRGGMGVVYLAHDASLDRLVALKVLADEITGDPVALARFHNEARMLARLSHPGIVPVYSVGEAGGRQFIAMEYVEGETLARRLQRDRTAGVETADPARIRGAVEVVASVAAALDHAHQNGIVHRDVKPSNVLVDKEGKARLTDFGVARRLDGTALTRTGDLAGTCRYMSPEQARASRTPVDGRSDVFSLGVVLYEALSLRPPFDGDNVAAILDSVIHGEPRRLTQVVRGLPRDLETVCHKALEKEPLRRYQTAAHLAADLRAFRAGQPILARPPSGLQRAARAMWRHRVASMATVSIVLVALAFVLWAQLAAVARARLCSLTVDSDGPNVNIVGQRVNEESLALGPPVKLGDAGTTQLVEPGLYRVTALGLEGRFAETSVYLVPGGSGLRIALPTRPSVPVPGDVEGMVLVPAGRYVLGKPDCTDPTSRYDAPRVVDLGAFLIDSTEVSNRVYGEFVVATGAPAPLGWPDPYDPAGLDELPVVGISREQAEDCARWLGKRLPTLDEWEVAARLGDGRLVPWGDQQPTEPLRTWTKARPISESDWRTAYLDTADAVGSRDDLASPAGLRHLMSNVAEYTFERAFDTGRIPTWKGGTWLQPIPDTTLVLMGPDEKVSFTTGFRCVRSLSPVSREP